MLWSRLTGSKGPGCLGCFAQGTPAKEYSKWEHRIHFWGVCFTVLTSFIERKSGSNFLNKAGQGAFKSSSLERSSRSELQKHWAWSCQSSSGNYLSSPAIKEGGFSSSIWSCHNGCKYKTLISNICKKGKLSRRVIAGKDQGFISLFIQSSFLQSLG